MRNLTDIYRPIGEADLSLLCAWRNSESFLDWCTSRKTILDEPEFRAELMADFSNDRCEQMLIVSKGQAVGTMFTYRYSVDGHVYMSIYLQEKARGRAIGVRAVALWCEELFDRLDLYKLYFEVLGSNAAVVRILTRFGLSCEAKLKGHRKIGAKRYDLLKFALYRSVLNSGISKLGKRNIL